jgi:hypothetical protein
MSLELEDFDEIDQFLQQHFERITPEEFKKNLKDACPDLFDNSNQLTNGNKATASPPENSLLVNNDPEYQEIDRILKEHFEKVTPEEFRKNLAIACPDLLENLNLTPGNQNYINVISIKQSKEVASLSPNKPPRKKLAFKSLSTAVSIFLLGVIASLGIIFIPNKVTIHHCSVNNASCKLSN